MAEIQGKGALKAEATVDRVLKELSRVGFSDLRRVLDANGTMLRLEKWDDDTAAAGRFGRSGDRQHRRR
ncbi:terminase [Sinorhizobium meliloti]|uniref:terminase n=1 Tax=Rhizobium meliloti TaxID=382 RepID=UPI0023806945|nr:terminase [Sinorhizobium meliloti]